jgi:hypothetical protein
LGCALSRTWKPLIYCLEECKKLPQQTLRILAMGLGC